MAQYTGNKHSKGNLLDVLLSLKQNINKDMQVAEICKILSITDDDIKVTSINKSEQLICTKLQNLDLQVDDIVLVVFTNTDFRINLSRIKANQQTQPLSKNVLHSSNFGVVVGLVYRKEEGGN